MTPLQKAGYDVGRRGSRERRDLLSGYPRRQKARLAQTYGLPWRTVRDRLLAAHPVKCMKVLEYAEGRA